MKKLLFLIIINSFLSFNIFASDNVNCKKLFELLSDVPIQTYIGGINLKYHKSNPEEKKYGYLPSWTLSDKGQLIEDVHFDSAFDNYGVKSGDYIQEINGLQISRDTIYEYAIENNVVPKKSSYGFMYDSELGYYDSNDQGIIVGDLIIDSPAWNAGIRPKDIIVSINDVFFFDEKNFYKFDHGEYNNFYGEHPSDLFFEVIELFRNSDYADEFYKLNIQYISSKDDELKNILISPKVLEMPLILLADWEVLDIANKNIYNIEENYDDFVIFSSEKQSSDSFRVKKTNFKYPLDIDFSISSKIKEINLKENSMTINADIWYSSDDPNIAEYLGENGINDFLMCDIDKKDFQTNYDFFPEIEFSDVLENKFSSNKFRFGYFPNTIYDFEEDSHYTLEDFRTVIEEEYSSENLSEEELEEKVIELIQEFKDDDVNYRYDERTFTITTFHDSETKIDLGRMNYFNFPFDKHDVSISLYNGYKDNLTIRADAESGKLEDTYFLTEWDVSLKSSKKENYISNDYKSEEINYVYTIKRDYGYYLIKVIAPMLLILTVCWSVFWINPAQIESRLTISVVCLLALIAYNFVFSDTLPKLGYPTLLDYLILSTYFMGALATLLTVLLFRLDHSGMYERSANYIGFFSKYILPLAYLILIYLFIGVQIEQQLISSLKLMIG